MTAVAVAPPAGDRAPGRPVRVLLTSRLVEQGALGLSTLFLAAMLGVDGFVPVSVLLIVNTLAVTASDFGLGVAVLRVESDAASMPALRRIRAVNAGVALLAAAAAAVVGSTAGAVLLLSGVIWFASAEAYVRKSAAIRRHRSVDAARAEILGTVWFTAFTLAAGFGPAPTLLFGVALAGKHAVEAAAVRSWRPAFAADGRSSELGPLWGTQVLAYLIANVDYVVVAAVLGRTSFAVYVLAFRVANALPAQLASVVSRVSLVRLGEAPDQRQGTYDHYATRLFVAGAIGAAGTIVAAPLLPLVLGDDWRATLVPLVVLALAVPWRLTLGLAGGLAVTGGATRRLLGWEVGRLAVTAAVLAVAAAAGFRPLVAAVTLSTVVAVLVYHRWAGRATGVTPWAPLVPAAAVTAVVAVAAAAWVPVLR